MAPALDTLADVLQGNDGLKALVCANGGPQLTRGVLRGLCAAFATALQQNGLKRGDVVTIADLNTAEFVIAFLGAAFARTVAAPLNSAYKEDEFKFYMTDASSRLLVVPPEGNKNAEKAAVSLGIPVVTVALSWSKGQFTVSLTPKSGGFQPFVGDSTSQLAAPPHPDDICLFLHTSGTTSRPKGVPLSHGNLAASIRNIIDTYEFMPQDVSLLVMPLFHVHGLMAGLLSPLAASCCVVLPAEGRFSAHTFWRDAVEHHVTFYTAVPTMHQILLARADKEYPASHPPPLRVIRSCSSALAPATLEQLERTFKAPVLEAYAMTEASHQMTSNPLPKYGPHKAGTVGKPQGGVKVAILDDKNNVLPPGKIGEVCILGRNVTKGYLNNPKANDEAFAGGWFHTGDQGFLDSEGYLTLTGRLKELINRGGEKISPIEVDGVLLSHPQVAEAVCFGAPDQKYGEVVSAAVVPKGPVGNPQALEEDIKKHAAQKLAAFKVPQRVFFTDKLPKTATGKIQRRMMVEHFIQGSGAAPPASTSTSADVPSDGYFVAARSLKAAGVTTIFGVVGIPVTQLASAAQAVGIRFIGTRNEQAAGYAAGAYGFLTGRPAVLLTVSGPGAVHGIAGLSNAQVNCWPMIMMSGSAEQAELGKGSFQELDQVAAVSQFCKYAGRANSVKDIPQVIQQAVQASLSGRPGAAYVDIPSNVLMAAPQAPPPMPSFVSVVKPSSDSRAVERAARLIRTAQRPLVVFCKGAAMSRAEKEARAFIDTVGFPFLGTAMGRGVVPDSHPLCVNAARSMALANADVALIVGGRLNWQLHFGDPPKWSPSVKFILLDIKPSDRDYQKCEVMLQGDAATVLTQLTSAVRTLPPSSKPFRGPTGTWTSQLRSKVVEAKRKLTKRLAATSHPLDFSTTLRIIRGGINGLTPAPVVVSEGANTMDNARVILEPVDEPRLRLDAGTWGTMGIGLGYAIAAATSDPTRLVIAVEGDSAFGFSGMEVETIVRYNLPIVIFVFNNGGIYGGDRRNDALRNAAQEGLRQSGLSSDPSPTEFCAQTRYDTLMTAFGGDAYYVQSAQELESVCVTAFKKRRPALVNIVIDPMAGVESGNVHAFNEPKAKL